MSVTKEQVDKKRQAKRAGKPGKQGWVGFLEVELTSEQKEQLRAMDVAAEFPLTMLALLTREGYKVSFGMDKDGVTCRASLTDVDTGSPTQGYTLVGRGEGVQNAFASLMYKHQHVLSGGWETHKQGNAALDFA